MSIVSIRNLNFGYQKNNAILKELNMTVPQGSIYGFLGTNGAGKSTTIRNILGLLKPQSGSITLFDEALQSSKKSIFQRVGSLIESPSLYPHLNAVDNLKIVCQYLAVPKSRIDIVLDKVNLLSHRKKKAKQYSTGMKQRLGLAMALIHDPELLILDEPTSGLDPNGITEIRNIITNLSAEGKTIMLSSHLLTEIEKMATQVGILKDGALVFEGTLGELDDWKSMEQTLAIMTSNVEKAKMILTDYEIINSDQQHLQIDISNKKDIPRIIEKLVQAEVELYEVKRMKSDLEKMFISITNE